MLILYYLTAIWLIYWPANTINTSVFYYIFNTLFADFKVSYSAPSSQRIRGKIPKFSEFMKGNLDFPDNPMQKEYYVPALVFSHSQFSHNLEKIYYGPFLQKMFLVSHKCSLLSVIHGSRMRSHIVLLLHRIIRKI